MYVCVCVCVCVLVCVNLRSCSLRIINRNFNILLNFD